MGWGPQGPQGSQETVSGKSEEGDGEGEGEGGVGDGEGEGAGGDEGRGVREEWMVTYFTKTIFTPAGIDVYSRRKEGLRGETLRAIMEGWRGVEREGFGNLVEGVFEVLRD